MGGKESKPVVDASQALNHLQRHERIGIEQEFIKLAQPPSLTGKIEKSMFMAFLAKVFCSCSEMILERIFQVTNFKGSGMIDYEEYLCLCFLLHFYDRQEYQLQFLFNLFDLDASGRISKKQYKKMSLAMLQGKPNSAAMQGKKSLSALVEMTNFLTFYNYDRTQDGTLTFPEWKKLAEEDDHIQHLMKCMERNVQQRNSRYIELDDCEQVVPTSSLTLPSESSIS
mmetsp:Transcript_15603/g.21931  ORF Transcript_15603/g.21931 Transcript_15603/m.21931 type:complete len:226 (-) Transcript_15603:125-802(-)